MFQSRIQARDGLLARTRPTSLYPFKGNLDILIFYVYLCFYQRSLLFMLNGDLVVHRTSRMKAWSAFVTFSGLQ
jgi:hypothetical protein